MFDNYENHITDQARADQRPGRESEHPDSESDCRECQQEPDYHSPEN